MYTGWIIIAYVHNLSANFIIFRKMKLVKKCRRAGVLPIRIQFPRNILLNERNTAEEIEDSSDIREALIYDD